MTAGTLPFEDPVGAFCRDNHVALKGADDGPLAGLAFGAKDVFHIAGTPTGFGHPTWLATHEPPPETATAVRRLLDAGADLAGKTHTDEMAYSLTGENVHYGTPVNARAPDRIPGGSSNGSAAAVTAGLVDFAIGTDCGGSVRLPASYCGILGMRPTVDRVPLDGVIPFGPPFDVAGWFARDAGVLEKAGRVLLADDSQPTPPWRLLRAADAFAMVDEAVARRPGSSRREGGGAGRRGRRRRRGARRAGILVRHVPGPSGCLDLGQPRCVDQGDEAGFRARSQGAIRVGGGARFDGAVVAAARTRYEAIRARIDDVHENRGTSCTFPPRPVWHRGRARRSTTSKSATATRRCTSCALRA